MKKDLTIEEWKRVNIILHSLLDITWEYAELRAFKISNTLDDSKPKRFEREPFKNFNHRLINWDKSKKDLYLKTFNEAKNESFNLVKELEEILIKLGLNVNK